MAPFYLQKGPTAPTDVVFGEIGAKWRPGVHVAKSGQREFALLRNADFRAKMDFARKMDFRAPKTQVSNVAVLPSKGTNGTNGRCLW